MIRDNQVSLVANRSVLGRRRSYAVSLHREHKSLSIPVDSATRKAALLKFGSHAFGCRKLTNTNRPFSRPFCAYADFWRGDDWQLRSGDLIVSSIRAANRVPNAIRGSLA